MWAKYLVVGSLWAAATTVLYYSVMGLTAAWRGHRLSRRPPPRA